MTAVDLAIVPFERWLQRARAEKLPLCPACRRALQADPTSVRFLGGAALVEGGVGHLDVSTHPHAVKTACGRVFARDEVGR